MEEEDLEGIVARFGGRGVDPAELRRIAVAALATARTVLPEAAFDRYAIVHVVGALKTRVREERAD